MDAWNQPGEPEKKSSEKAASSREAVKAIKSQGRKLKFTYKEQKEWDTIEGEIAGLEEKIAELDGEIQKAASSYSRLQELMTEKEKQEKLLEEKMERWMYLNELAEKIASQ